MDTEELRERGMKMITMTEALTEAMVGAIMMGGELPENDLVVTGDIDII